jgi:hypothetical protein
MPVFVTVTPTVPSRQGVEESDLQMASWRSRNAFLHAPSDLWVQASLDYKQRLQQLFFPEGIAFDGTRFIEPPQRHHFSTTWRRPRVLMKRW